MSQRLIIILALIFSAVESRGQAPVAIDGLLNLSSWDFDEHRIALNGNWMFFEDRLVSPTGNDDYTFSPFPGTWNSQRATGDGQGVGSYRLMILLPHKTPPLALQIPQIYSSYKLWINDSLFAVNGKVGPTAAETVPEWRPQTLALGTHRDTLHIHLQIANFNHHKGGIKDPIILGSRDILAAQRSVSVWSNWIEAVLLAGLGLCFILIWGADKKKVTVYFSMLCLTWALRSLFSNLYVFDSEFPDFSWTATVKIEYITLFLSLVWALLFTHRLFPNESANAIKYLLVGINLAFAAFALFTSPLQFTQFLYIYLITAGVVLFYILMVAVRAWVNERSGVLYIVFSFLVGILMFAYDLTSYEGFFAYHPVVFSWGYLAVFYLMAPVLLIHLRLITSRKKPGNVLTYKDLYEDENR